MGRNRRIGGEWEDEKRKMIGRGWMEERKKRRGRNDRSEEEDKRKGRGEERIGKGEGEKIDWERKEKKRRRIEEYSIRYNNI